ncbi:hypothetical protein, partial [Chryseosolibacter indicus]
GTTTYYVSQTVGGCESARASIVVNVNQSPNAGVAATVPACSSETNFNLLVNLGGTPDGGGSWTDLDNSGANIVGDVADLSGITADGAYRFEYRVSSTGCADATAILTLNVTNSPDAGIDNEVTACNTNNAFDLYASLDGNPDAGGSWFDIDGSGAAISGNSIDLTTLAVGTYHYRYTVSATAPCAAASAVVTVKVIDTTPNAGTDNTVDACNSELAFDLLGSLGGSPDPGGLWTDLDNSGAVITGDNANLAGVATGSYRFQYALSVVGCGNASSILTINVEEGPDAGEDATVLACNSESSFDLLGSLDGNPDAGGTWVQISGAALTITGDAVDLSGAVAGLYEFEYTVKGTGPCADVKSILTIDVKEAADAGSDNTVQACNTETAFDLFVSLGGTPNAGGTWTQTSGSIRTITGNTVNLSGAVAGAYTFKYVVTGTAPCAKDSATVTVNVNKAPNAGVAATVPACSSETNFNLLANLGGTPDGGGTWTDLDNSGANIVGDVADLSGITADGAYRFEYRVSSTGCADATAILTL